MWIEFVLFVFFGCLKLGDDWCYVFGFKDKKFLFVDFDDYCLIGGWYGGDFGYWDVFVVI